MIVNRRSLLGGAILLLAGCATIFQAQEAQERVAKKSRPDAPGAKTEALCLRGRGLAELVDFALTNRPSIVAARLAVKDARLTLRQLAADAPLVSETPWTAPNLSLSGAYSESSEGISDNRGGSWATVGSPSAALSLELPIWDFGRYSAKAAQQRENVLSSELTLTEDGYTVFGEVALAYFNYLEKDALFEVALTNEARYATQCAYAEERCRAGEADRLDVLRARLDLAQARQQTVSASNDITTAGATLMHALGVDVSRGTCERVLGRPDLGMGHVYRAFAPTENGVAEAYALARTNAPALCIRRAELRAASHAVDYAIADLMPNVSATASLSWTDPLWYWGWGVNAAQSLFQGFRKTTAVDRAVVALEQASVSVDQAEQDLSKSIELAIAVRDNARKELETAVAAVRSAKENYETVRSQWGIGDVSRVDLSNAAGEYSAALGDRVSAFYSGQRAEAAIFALLGRYPTYQERKEEMTE